MNEPPEAAAPMEAIAPLVRENQTIQRYLRQPPTRERDAWLGETFARLSREFGKAAAGYLFQSQWRYQEPEWFDHRLHLLDPDRYFNDFWTASSDNVINSLPYGGSLLDLCSGDGFYDYWFYRHRASVMAVERDRTLVEFAGMHHGHSQIMYVCADVLTWFYPHETFDCVVIRGAIEHFSAENQQRIFQKSLNALKPGGWFCGDTPAKKEDGLKALSAHECEWRDEAEMREALGHTFSDIETRTLISQERTTLLWRCRK
ncbi:MAG TPA: class I SAM-dependent methyltransferase [Nitrospiraceae bacterium]|jgi:SAM-dependent methyltransferase|nr:class I SAM-dependent methyltransferase [Nitrospiraceae bacterium]